MNLENCVIKENLLFFNTFMIKKKMWNVEHCLKKINYTKIPLDDI